MKTAYGICAPWMRNSKSSSCSMLRSKKIKQTGSSTWFTTSTMIRWTGWILKLRTRQHLSSKPLRRPFPCKTPNGFFKTKSRESSMKSVRCWVCPILFTTKRENRYHNSSPRQRPEIAAHRGAWIWTHLHPVNIRATVQRAIVIPNYRVGITIQPSGPVMFMCLRKALRSYTAVTQIISG